MSKHTLLQRAVRLALANAAAASVVAPAIGIAADQAVTPPPATPTATSAPTPALQEVVVTGSRIVDSRPQVDQPGYVPQRRGHCQDRRDFGRGRAEPAAAGDGLPTGSMDSNGSSGIATVDLRHLDAKRTLVLIDGQRLMPGDLSPSGGITNAADINNIPTALVQRVEVLTGGASSVYGADAVAGVVNFVMNDHFQGFEIDANASINQHAPAKLLRTLRSCRGLRLGAGLDLEGGEKDVTFIMGGDFAGGKGNATAYVGWRKTQPVLRGAVDFSRCTLYRGPNAADRAPRRPAAFWPSTRRESMVTTSRWAASHNRRSIRPPVSSCRSRSSTTTAPLNYYMRPDERWNGGTSRTTTSTTIIRSSAHS